MSRSPDCCCHCSSTYNVRKLRISDGRTVWRRLLTYVEDGVTHNQARDCAIVGCECGETSRLVVGLANIGTRALPHGLSARNGQTFWVMDDEDRLLVDELDANEDGQWLGIFSRTNPVSPPPGVYLYNPIGELTVLNSEAEVQWATLRERTEVSAKFGHDTFIATDTGLASAFAAQSGFITYGDSSDGSQSYHLTQTTNAVRQVFGITSEIAIVELVTYEVGGTIRELRYDYYDLANHVPWTSRPIQIPGGFFTGSAPSGTIYDATWKEREGVHELFLCTNYKGTAIDNRTGTALNDKTGLLRITPPGHIAFDYRMVETGTRPSKMWRCEDGMVVICGDSSFTIGGVTCEIFKCDFDLNVLWRKLWRGVGAGNGLRGLTGDDDHVYISGGVGSWQCD